MKSVTYVTGLGSIVCLFVCLFVKHHQTTKTSNQLKQTQNGIALPSNYIRQSTSIQDDGHRYLK